MAVNRTSIPTIMNIICGRNCGVRRGISDGVPTKGDDKQHF